MLSIYRASAGSGKTYTLTYQYIKLLLGYKDDTGKYRLRKKIHNAHRSILAITFTNKATDEMKRRIIHELAVLAGKEPGWTDPSPYLPALKAELGATEDDLRKIASDALQQILYDFNFFRVSTIDSFFQTILRTFAHEAELSGNYELELNGDNAIDEGVARMFTSLENESESRESRHLVSWIKTYLLDCLRQGKKVNIMNRESMPYHELLGLIKKLSDETLALRYDEMMEYLADPARLERFNISLTQKISTARRNAQRIVSSIDSQFDSQGLYSGTAKIKENVKNCIQEFLRTGEFKSTIDTYLSKSPDEKPKFSISAALVKQLDNNPDSNILENIDLVFRTMSEARSEIGFYEMLRSNTFVLGILASVFRRIDEYRKENNILLLSDTNGLLRRIIGEDDTPFIYERMGEALHHFLIDEFQDTSAMQWENLRPLLSHSLAEGNDSLIIGDEKQCIYRFRNSDPSLLSSQVEADFRRSGPQGLENKDGNKNWRSLPRIVEFNNRLFRNFAAQYAPVEYSNVWQELGRKENEYDTPGYVRIADIPSADNGQEKLYSMMAEEIARQIRAGYSPGDIAVLVRKNKEGIDIINYLNERQKEEDFPKFSIVSEDVVRISASPAVRMIISELRLSLLATSTIQEVPSPRKKRTADDIARLIGRYDSLLIDNPDPSVALEKALKGEGKYYEPDSSLVWTLISAVEEIINTRIPYEMYVSQQAYISAFLDLVADYSKIGLNDIRSFLNWWDTVGSRSNLLVPLAADALKVMTVHKSKGLEFPCVHIPVQGWSVTDFRGVEWFDLSSFDFPDMPPMIPLRPSSLLKGTPLEEQYDQRLREVNVDELNALYVAFTRAERELCVWNMNGRVRNEIGPRLIEAIFNVFSPDSFITDDNQIPVFSFGEPTSPAPRIEKKKNAAEPSETLRMPVSKRNIRKNIWDGLNIEVGDDT